MKPTKNTFKEELQFRISLLEREMEKALKEPKDENNIYWFLAMEHSTQTEILETFELFQNREQQKAFDMSKCTPILDYNTKEPLKIGDKVESLDKRCGTLEFDDYTMRYVIKNPEGGHIHSTTFIKITELYDYRIDVSRVECRPSNRINKKKW